MLRCYHDFYLKQSTGGKIAVRGQGGQELGQKNGCKEVYNFS